MLGAVFFLQASGHRETKRMVLVKEVSIIATEAGPTDYLGDMGQTKSKEYLT